jgi:hypothetical protein
VSVSTGVPPRAAVSGSEGLGLVGVDRDGLPGRGVNRGCQCGSVEEDLANIASTERGLAGSGLAGSDPALAGLARLFFKSAGDAAATAEERQR